jgi:hypothetical protein
MTRSQAVFPYIAPLLALYVVTAAEPLDRILARVNGHVITLTDVRAASALHLIAVPDDDLSLATYAVVDRRLVLIEALRGQPNEPQADLVDAEVVAMTARVGGQARLVSIMEETGITDDGLRQIARESLWTAAYRSQRFGDAPGSVAGDAWLVNLRRRATIKCEIPGC